MAPATIDSSEPVATRLNGCWMVVSARLGGMHLPDTALEGIGLALENTVFEIGGERGRMTIDWDATPASIDVVILEGPNRGRFLPGIVECRSHQLRICFDLSGTQRPLTFEAQPGSRQFVALCERHAPDRVTP